MLVKVWSGSFVEESNLTVAISTLRRALQEDPQDRRYIQTVARRGYRFIAEVREVQPAPRVVKAAQVEAAEPAPASVPVQRVPEQPMPVQPAKPPAKSRLRLWPVQLFYLLLLAGLGAGFWFFGARHQAVRTLAVLPIRLQGPIGGGAMSNDEMSLAMTDEIISRLDAQFEVRPTSSVLSYSSASRVDAIAAGREQGVDAVLTGEADGAGGKTRLRLRLIRVSDGLTLWQQQFESAAGNLPQLEQDAAEAVAAEMRRLGARPNKPAAGEAPAHQDDPAYQLYLRGRYFWNQRTVDGLRKSADYFRQSIAADPNYAPAYAGLADSYALLASFSVEPGSEANAAARSAALSAIQLDPTLAEPHASLGMIYFFTDWNLAAAQKEFERAIQLNPNYATAHHWYALDLAAMGRFPEALYEIRLAQKLDPLSLIIGTNVGWIEYLARDYPAATRDLGKVLELDPNFARARTRLGMVEMATGAYPAAVTDLTQAVALSGSEDPWVEGLLGDAEARAGNTAAAERTLAQLRKRSSTEYVPPISRALVLLGLKRNGEALAELQRSADDHSTAMVYARVDPSLDAVRGDPGFQSLLSRIKL